ncbi:MAG TPA: serine/threonine-protein kinase [Polyangiaceae bacterium]|nr:serine/threonine-protein kinase [Polyangiaceae bacterium]
MAAPKLIDTNYDGPQRIDRYDLVAEIASGGMATVYLANLSGVGGFRRFVAIKRLHPHLAKEQEFVEMFLDEARLAAGIHHPHVVPILEVGASERGYYLVMEYIEGDTLARLLARAATAGKRLPASIGVRVVVDMLTGLHAAHELRDETGMPTELVHRDVSPQNILVGMDGNTRITDFGVARAASRLSATRAGQLKGKIAYMAPEQAVGDPSVDRRADVFSSGIVLWEVLAARRLFKAENEAATLSRVISEPIPDIREVNPDIDAGVAAVVMKALERDRDGRYPTCQEFADDLERAARAANLIATTREVAAYVGEVIGQEISQQRDAVRAWLARSEPSQAIPDIVELPHSSSAPPLGGLPQVATGEQSGMVASPIAAPLGAPLVETGGQSKAPWVIIGAAAAGFIIVALLVLLFRKEETQPPVVVQQAPVVQQPVQPAAVPAPSPSPAAAPAPAAVAPAAPAAVPEEPTAARPEPGARPARIPHGGAARPGPAAASPAATPTAAPKPAPAAPPSDIDLSNPYK